MSEGSPRLYADLAGWYHLLTPPAEYDVEAAFYLGLFRSALGHAPASLLELGSGGGNMASHYKRDVPRVVLTDLSEAMLDQSRRINPECAHAHGDMRTLRFGETFEAVFAHDALDYLTGEADVRAALETAFVHTRPGGAAVFAPDHVRETFAEGADHGGSDSADGRGIRYLEWTWDPDPTDTRYTADYAYLLHEPGAPTRVVLDQHVCGLFPRATWLRLLGEVGFRDVQVTALEHPEVEPGEVEVFVARRP